MYLNSVQQMVSGELAGEGLQTGFSRHGLPPQRAPLDTVYPLRKHLNSVQRMVSGGYCEGLFPDTVCWTRLRNTWGPKVGDRWGRPIYVPNVYVPFPAPKSTPWGTLKPRAAGHSCALKGGRRTPTPKICSLTKKTARFLLRANFGPY